MHSHVQLNDSSQKKFIFEKTRDKQINNKTLFQIFSFQTTKKIFEHVFLK
jgi:hypothetical protein